MIEVPAPRNIEPSFHTITVGEAGVLNVWEEAGTLWVLAHPELMQWSASIHWLFSRVSGEGPGDLWGVDEHGELLVVETKRSHRRAMRLTDPFEDFVKDRYPFHPTEFSTEKVRETWCRQLEAEWKRQAESDPVGDRKLTHLRRTPRPATAGGAADEN